RLLRGPEAKRRADHAGAGGAAARRGRDYAAGGRRVARGAAGERLRRGALARGGAARTPRDGRARERGRGGRARRRVAGGAAHSARRRRAATVHAGRLPRSRPVRRALGMNLNVAFLGRVEYRAAEALQERLRARILDGDADAETLLLLEHDPVITL